MSDQTPATKKQLRAKAAGMYSGISALPKEVLLNRPSVEFANDYNILLANVANSCPNLDSRHLLPPVVAIEPYRHNSAIMEAQTVYGELLSYVTQIVNLLNDDVPIKDGDPKR